MEVISVIKCSIARGIHETKYTWDSELKYLWKFCQPKNKTLRKFMIYKAKKPSRK